MEVTGGGFGRVCHRLRGPGGSPAHAIWLITLPNSRAGRRGVNRRPVECLFESNIGFFTSGVIR